MLVFSVVDSTFKRSSWPRVHHLDHFCGTLIVWRVTGRVKCCNDSLPPLMKNSVHASADVTSKKGDWNILTNMHRNHKSRNFWTYFLFQRKLISFYLCQKAKKTNFSLFTLWDIFGALFLASNNKWHLLNIICSKSYTLVIEWYHFSLLYY